MGRRSLSRHFVFVNLAAASGLLLLASCRGADAAPLGGPGPTQSVPATPTATPASISAGTWGGRGIALTISQDGTALVELDCARGTIPPPLTLRGDGAFEWKGTLDREGPGPIHQGRSDAGRPVRLRGDVRGETMTLSIEPGGSISKSDSIGSFTLARGGTPRLRKCS